MNIVPSNPSVLALPAPLPPQIERGLRFATAKLEPPIEPGRARYTIAVEDAPNDDLRRSLDVRRSRIDGWMLPAGPVLAAEQGRMLTAVMAFRDDDPTAARQFGAIFTQDLMDLPAFALIQACSDFRRGIVGDGKWMPEPGVVRREAQKRVASLARERREIDAVLSAEVRATAPNPELRDRLIQAAKDLADTMRKGAEAEKRGRMTDQEIREVAELDAAIRENRPDRRPMPRFSAEHRRALGLPPELPPEFPTDRFVDDDRIAS